MEGFLSGSLANQTSYYYPFFLSSSTRFLMLAYHGHYNDIGLLKASILLCFRVSCFHTFLIICEGWIMVLLVQVDIAPFHVVFILFQKL
jgi:hypothetical protein